MHVVSPNLSAADPVAEPKSRSRQPRGEHSTRRRARIKERLATPNAAAEAVEGQSPPPPLIDPLFQPENDWQRWLTGEVAVLMVRITRCSRVEQRLRDWASYRAIDFWEDDQVLEVEILAAKLPRQPARTLARLRQSPAGCDWLIKRWRGLAQLDPGAWTEEQRALARQLVGGDELIDPTAPGFAAGQVADLAAQRSRVEEADAILREMVEADLSDDHVPGLGRLRRYQRSMHRQMQWYLNQLHGERAVASGEANRSSPAIVPPDRNLEGHTPRPEPGNDETKPLEASLELKNAETKPLGRYFPGATLASAFPKVVRKPGVSAEVRGQGPVARSRRSGRALNAADRRREALGALAGL